MEKDIAREESQCNEIRITFSRIHVSKKIFLPQKLFFLKIVSQKNASSNSKYRQENKDSILFSCYVLIQLLGLVLPEKEYSYWS